MAFLLKKSLFFLQEHNGPEYKAQVADTRAQQGGMYGGGDGVE